MYYMWPFVYVFTCPHNGSADKSEFWECKQQFLRESSFQGRNLSHSPSAQRTSNPSVTSILLSSSLHTVQSCLTHCLPSPNHKIANTTLSLISLFFKERLIIYSTSVVVETSPFVLRLRPEEGRVRVKTATRRGSGLRWDRDPKWVYIKTGLLLIKLK